MTTPAQYPMIAPTIVRNLLPGQYQFGNIVMGRGTTIRVESLEIKPDDVNNQDYQIPLTDDKRFGWDALSPTTMQLTCDVLENRLLPQFEGAIPNFWAEMPTVSDLKREWRADEVRFITGQMKPLYVCGSDGITRAVFGRPGQFTYAQNTPYTEAIQCLGEFRRGDTLSYSVKEKVYDMTQAAPTISVPGTDGDAPSWIRILAAGPIVNPVFSITGLYLNGFTIPTPFVVGLDYTVAADEVIEINAYPWARRAVSNNGLVLSPFLSGATPYLDRLRFGHDATVGVTMTGTGMTSATEALFLFRDAYQVVG